MDTSNQPTLSGMPALGLGTWQNTDPDQCAESVEAALEMGYRHIDTAQAYGNEESVGRGIASSTVAREDVFLATKVWLDNLAHDDVLETARASLDRLGVDYVDLLYVHWPARTYDPEGTLSAFDQLYEEGITERVGVSNFTPELLAEAVTLSEAPIFANQVEMHPLLPQKAVRDAATKHDVHIVAYSPLARGVVFDVPEIQSVAEKYDASPAQVSLAWLREKGVAAIPKATSVDHLRDNWNSLDLELDGGDIDRLDAIETQERQVDPAFAPW